MEYPHWNHRSPELVGGNISCNKEQQLGRILLTYMWLTPVMSWLKFPSLKQWSQGFLLEVFEDRLNHCGNQRTLLYISWWIDTFKSYKTLQIRASLLSKIQLFLASVSTFVQIYKAHHSNTHTAVLVAAHYMCSCISLNIK